MPSVGPPPAAVDDCQRAGLEQGHPPSAPAQNGEPDPGHHGSSHTRAHDRREACAQAQPVATVDASVVVGEQQVRQPKSQGQSEGDLERPEDVVVAHAEQDEDTRDGGRDPGAYPARRITTLSNAATTR